MNDEEAKESQDMTDATISIKDYTTGEEVFSSIVHGIGMALSIAAIVLMAVVSVSHGAGVRLAAALVFGISLFFEYTASTFYHALPQPKAKRVFKVLDHSGIYLLIAGTYTPFTLITLAENGGLALFAVIWVAALAGIACEAFWTFRPRWVSAAIYVVMGWAAVVKLPALLAALPTAGFALLVAGGIVYTAGCAFYLMKKIKYMHSIWHLFVLGGSVCHFLCVILYVL